MFLVIGLVVCLAVTFLILSVTGQLWFLIIAVPVIIGLIFSLPISIVVYFIKRELTSKISGYVFLFGYLASLILIIISGGFAY